MVGKINKALDYNKLLEQQAKGKLLKKVLSFPLIAEIKYDGNYVVIIVSNNSTEFITSGGLNYTHTDKGGDIFKNCIDGVYLAERIGNEGKLGDRRLCNLKGPKSNQTSTNHSYKVFDYLTLDEYTLGYSNISYYLRYEILQRSGLPKNNVIDFKMIYDKDQLNTYISQIIKDGYEGLMLYNPDFKWEDTKSRNMKLCKYKKRKTADLKCIGFTEGTGKYTGMIGSLQLTDSIGRLVDVGSGLNDGLRELNPDRFIGKVIEIEYEQIIDTYIQPTFIQVREDKNEEDID